MSPPPQILKHFISYAVSLAQLVSPSVALPAEVVCFFFVRCHLPNVVLCLCSVSSVVSLAQLVSPSVALLAKLVRY